MIDMAPLSADEIKGPAEVSRSLLNADKKAMALLRGRLFGLRHGLLVSSSVCIAVALLGAAVWLFYYGGLLSLQLDRDARETSGVLSEIQFTERPFASGWSLYYVFKTQGRVRGGVSYWRGKPLPDEFKVGASVTVELLPGREAKVNRVKGTQLELASPWFFHVFWISALLGMLLAAFSAVRAWRDQQMLKTGAVTAGVIRSRGMAVRLRFFGLPPARFTYTYSDKQGNPYMSRLVSYYPEAVLELLPGDEVTVFYNPRKPKASIMVDGLIGSEPLRRPREGAAGAS